MSKPTAPTYYVVFEGWTPGVYDEWIKVKMNTNGYIKPLFKKFDQRKQAYRAFHAYKRRKPESVIDKIYQVNQRPVIYTDIRCWRNLGAASYKSILIGNDGMQVLVSGEVSPSTENISEFLSIVDTLIYCQENNINATIYSKSTTALSWVKKRSCNTDLTFNQQTKATHKRIENAVRWLEENKYDNEVLKYEMNPDIEFALNICHQRSAS